MSHSKDEILNILAKSLNEKGQWLLATLIKSEKPLYKEELWELTNKHYKDLNRDEPKLLVSRYSLDINTARLEGAGLVKVREIGKVRMFSASPLGQEIAAHINK